MLVAMIAIGAITRLTESGLSMVEWRAMIDMLPPLSDAAWMSEFEKYKLTPEYLQKNTGMALDQFKQIYFWEWLHRLWGRLIGLVFALPLAYFWVQHKIPSYLKPRLLGLLALGGLQGFFGWYMVKSGLINEPRVSHYRLALHLGTAFLILSLTWAQVLALVPSLIAWRTRTSISLKPYRGHFFAAFGVVCLTMLWGVFVAGLDAGLVYNEFPLMGGNLVPGELLFENPWWQNFLTNHASVQWLHRVLGVLSFLAVFSFGYRLNGGKIPRVQLVGRLLMGGVLVQFILGITTLLTHVAVPVAAMHQLGAVFVLMMLVAFWVMMTPPRQA